jgi:Uma2 family endonuclease
MNLQRRGATQRATYADVLAAPETMIAELIRGALHLQPRPSMPHVRAGSALGAKIGGPFDYDGDGPGGWWIADEPEVHLGEHVVVPDLAGWRRARMPRFPRSAYVTLAPDWVCEIHSPSTRRIDRTDKRAIYGEHGVGWLWLVDPEDRTLEAFAMGEAGWTLIAALGADAQVRVAPFDAVSFPLGSLWADDGGEDGAG